MGGASLRKWQRSWDLKADRGPSYIGAVSLFLRCVRVFRQKEQQIPKPREREDPRSLIVKIKLIVKRARGQGQILLNSVDQGREFQLQPRGNLNSVNWLLANWPRATSTEACLWRLTDCSPSTVSQAWLPRTQNTPPALFGVTGQGGTMPHHPMRFLKIYKEGPSTVA